MVIWKAKEWKFRKGWEKSYFRKTFDIKKDLSWKKFRFQVSLLNLYLHERFQCYLAKKQK